MTPEIPVDNPAVEIEQQDADEFVRALFTVLRGSAKADHLVRRCLEHHVELDYLVCPTGLHPTRIDRRLMNDMNHTGTNWTGDVWRWEVYNTTTGRVVARVMDVNTIEWEEDPVDEAIPQLAGRLPSGVAPDMKVRRGGARHRVERDIGRPGRRRTSEPRWGPRQRVA